MNKPRLIITQEHHLVGLDSTSWEQRQGYRDRNGARIEERAGLGMSAAELIELMGPLWACHPQFQARPRSLLPMPNLAGRQPVISFHRADLWAEFKRAFTWTSREQAQ